jgi:hypothetical protein
MSCPVRCMHGMLMFRYDPAGSGHAASPEELDAVLHHIGSNKPAYEAMLAWKHSRVSAFTTPVGRNLAVVFAVPQICSSGAWPRGKEVLCLPSHRQSSMTAHRALELSVGSQPTWTHMWLHLVSSC